MEVAAVRRERSDTTQLAASKRFGRFRPEKEQAVRKPEVKENPVLGEMKAAFIDIEYDCDSENSRDLNYKAMIERTKMIVCTAEDIENFSIMLAELQDEKDLRAEAGLFLSALINNCQDSDYIIHTAHLSVNIDVIGFRNTKNILIKGHAGDDVGADMVGGSIIVEGNASEYVGWDMKGGEILIKGNVAGDVGHQMKGGSITVEGNVGEYIGNRMEGGSITVEGNVGKYIGWLMKGGEIHLNGDCEPLFIADDLEGGRIYHRGKLISDR